MPAKIIIHLNFIMQSPWFHYFRSRKYKLLAMFGLDRRNLQWLRLSDLISQPKIFCFNFLMDLKVKSIHSKNNIELRRCIATSLFYVMPGRMWNFGLWIRRAGIWKIEKFIMWTIQFYSTLSTCFWYRMELFGNIWPWQAQFGQSKFYL
jgi:hypothetical protein